MVNDGGEAKEEALQEERMLYVWDQEDEGAPLAACLCVCSLLQAQVSVVLSYGRQTRPARLCLMVRCACLFYFYFFQIVVPAKTVQANRRGHVFL